MEKIVTIRSCRDIILNLHMDPKFPNCLKSLFQNLFVIELYSYVKYHSISNCQKDFVITVIGSC